MSNPSPLALAARLALLVRSLIDGISQLYIGGQQGGLIPRPLIAVVMARLNSFQDRLNRLAGRIIAGTYAPRRTVPRQTPIAGKPRTESPLREFGWLAGLLPPAVAQQQRSHILGLLRDPEIAALIAVAPAEMGRLLRPLCWMVKLKPPPILARPKPQGEAGPPAPPPKYQPPPPPPPPIPGPANAPGLHPHQRGRMRPPPKRI